MNSNRWLFVILSTLLVANCSSSKDDDKPEIIYTNLLESIGPDEMKEQIDVNAQLAEAATSVSSSLNKLAEIKLSEMKYDPAKQEESFAKVKGMNEISSIDWNGPVEPILRKIAAAGKHKFKVMGRAPSIPILIDLDMRNVALSDILQNITYQAAGKAHIVYVSKEDTIELRYIEI